MDDRDEVLQRATLVTAQAKRVLREARILSQMAAGLRDNLQPDKGHKEEVNATEEQD